MDEAFTYSTQNRVRLTVYTEPGYEPPDILVCQRNGNPVEFLRLSDMSLVCERVSSRIDGQGNKVPVSGDCGNFDCHRKVLGECQCGRHSAPVRFRRAG